MSELATSYNNIGAFYDVQKHLTKAEIYYLKAIIIREKLIKENPDKHSPELAISYYNYALFSHNMALMEKALELAKTRPDHPLCKKIIAMLEQA